MSKPIYIREETWLFLLQKLANLQGKTFAVLNSLGYVLPLQEGAKDDDVLPLLAEQPGPFLLYAGILKYPSLLVGTIIEANDGTEYLITEKAAKGLQHDDHVVVLQNYCTKKLVAIPRDEVIDSLKQGLLFDQMSRSTMQHV